MENLDKKNSGGWGKEQLASLQSFMDLALHRNVLSTGLSFLEVTNRVGGKIVGVEVEDMSSSFIREAERRGFADFLPAQGETLTTRHIRAVSCAAQERFGLIKTDSDFWRREAQRVISGN